MRKPPSTKTPSRYVIAEEKGKNFSIASVFGFNVFGVSHSLGNGPIQQNALAITSTPSISSLTVDEIQRAQETTLNDIQNQIGVKYDESGSTALLITSKNLGNNKVQFITSYLGNSQGFLVTVNKSNDAFNCRSLNPALHNTAISVYNQQNYSVLSINRSLGNNAMEEKTTFSHVPQTNIINLTLNEGEKIIVIAACDGLTENNSFHGTDQKYSSPQYQGLSLPEIGQCASDFFRKGDSHKSTAEKLMLAARSKLEPHSSRQKHPSEDNISILVGQPQPDITFAIFDGNGKDGHTCANEAATAFHDYLIRNTSIILDSKNTDEKDDNDSRNPLLQRKNQTNYNTLKTQDTATAADNDIADRIIIRYQEIQQSSCCLCFWRSFKLDVDTINNMSSTKEKLVALFSYAASDKKIKNILYEFLGETKVDWIITNIKTGYDVNTVVQELIDASTKRASFQLAYSQN